MENSGNRASYPNRLWQWAKERFPPVNIFSSFVIYLMTLSTVRLSAGTSVTLSLHDLLGAIALTGQFLILRILDEHKDFEDDRVNYPQRALQSGLITLSNLRVLAWIAGTFSFILSIGSDAVLSWGLVTAWSFLMYHEFFCGEWLRKKLFLYAVSHMVIMPLLMLWTFRLCSPRAQLGTSSWLLISLTFVSGLAFEFTRKTRGAEEEKKSLDSYSKIIGPRACGFLLMGVLTVVLINQFFLVRSLFGSPWVILAFSAAGFCASQISIISYIRTPSLKMRKLNEAFTGLFMLLNYLGLIVAPLIQSGWKWA